MHLYQLAENVIINLDFLITLGWETTNPTDPKSRYLTIRLASPGEAGPITYHFKGKDADQLWKHVLNNVVEMIP